MLDLVCGTRQTALTAASARSDGTRQTARAGGSARTDGTRQTASRYRRTASRSRQKARGATATLSDGTPASDCLRLILENRSIHLELWDSFGFCTLDLVCGTRQTALTAASARSDGTRQTARAGGSARTDGTRQTASWYRRTASRSRQKARGATATLSDGTPASDCLRLILENRSIHLELWDSFGFCTLDLVCGTRQTALTAASARSDGTRG